MNKPNDTHYAHIPKIKIGGNPRYLEPQTDCRYYHGTGLFDRSKIKKNSKRQILRTIILVGG
ncbi:hypothetical protein D3C85_1639270 [compost metagenome]